MSAPWIPSHVDLQNHPKLRRLCRALHVTPPTAIGHLHMLWWYAFTYASLDGDLSRFDADDIADACCWDGDSAVFVDALQRAGFLDGMSVHDYEEHIGRYAVKRAQDAERKRMSRGRPADIQRTAHVHNQQYQQNLTNRTEPTEPTPLIAVPTAAAPAASDDDYRHAVKAWEAATGTMITRQTGDAIDSAIGEYGHSWVIDAIKETGDANARSWKYTAAILRRWQVEGRNAPRVNGSRGSPAQPTLADQLAEYGYSLPEVKP